MRISVRSRSDHFHVVFYAREILWLKNYPFLKQSVPYGNLTAKCGFTTLCKAYTL